jgi:hypothetical protein
MAVNARPGAWVNNFDESLAQLLAGPYVPKPYTQTTLNGRELIVPTAYDRVVQGALQLALQPAYNKAIPSTRKGSQGLHAALKDTSEYLAKTPSCAFFRSDIKGFFPNIKREVALGRVRQFASQHLGEWEIQAILAAISASPDPNGLPSGSPLSPLLADICLLPMDRDIQNVFYLRYMDDLLIMGEPNEVATQRDKIQTHLNELGLTLSEKKTIAGNWPTTGFTLLGQTFGTCAQTWPNHADYLVKGGPEAMGMKLLPGPAPTPLRGISLSPTQSRWADDKHNIRIWSLNHFLRSLADKPHPEMLELLISPSILKDHPIGQKLRAIRDSFLHAGMPKALHDTAFKTYVGTIKKAHAANQPIPLDKASLVVRSLQISLAIMRHGKFPESWEAETTQHDTAIAKLIAGDYQGYRNIVSSLFKEEYPLREQQKHNLPLIMPYQIAVEKDQDPLGNSLSLEERGIAVK